MVTQMIFKKSLILSLLLSSVGSYGMAQTSQISSETSSTVETQPDGVIQSEAQNLEDARWYPATGSDLLNLIEGCEDASCMSFVAGTLTGLATREYTFGRESPFCTSDQLPVQDLRDALITVIGSDEELQSMPVSFGVLATFSVMWPCDADQDPLQNIASTDTSSFGMENLKPIQDRTMQEIFESHPASVTLGDPMAITSKTLVVFHDPNCPHCQEFKPETDKLVQQGWKINVLSVGILGEDSVAYSAMMYAVSQQYPELAEILYREAIPGEANVAAALKIAQDYGVSAPEILALVTQTGAYEYVGANAQLMEELGSQGTPSWILSNYIHTGSSSAQDIQKVSEEIPTAKGDVGPLRPGTTNDTTGALIVPLPDTQTSQPKDISE
jgi:protein-disulfide isomerase